MDLPTDEFEVQNSQEFAASSPTDLSEEGQERTRVILNTFQQSFEPEIRANPKGWQSRFRKMASNEFAFYRGSAVLFYADMIHDINNDQWIQASKRAANIFIHGDLHAENFGTYMDSNGIINFDVNDFDESYIGPFTWDIKRLAASLNLIGNSKALADEKISELIQHMVSSYIKQIYLYCESPEANRVGLTINNTEGAVQKLLNEARLSSKQSLLDKMTVIENYDRRLIRSETSKDLEPELREAVSNAFQNYLSTIPSSKKTSNMPSQIKDVVSRTSGGIGSAGRTSYTILLQGKTQALESDIVLYMKPASKSAVSDVWKIPELEQYFHHNGLRIVLSTYAMQAVTSRWLGYATLHDNEPMLVDEVATHVEEIDWKKINGFDEMCQVADYLGKATAKIHCVADIDSIRDIYHTDEHTTLLPLHIIPKNTEHAIRDAIGGRDEDFIQDMIRFAMNYGDVVRRDHHLFSEAFRNDRIEYVKNP